MVLTLLPVGPPSDSPILNKTFNSLTLDVQLSQFEQFRERSFESYHEGRHKLLTVCFNFRSAITNELKNRLPWSMDYTRALYTFDIGQNDLQAWIISKKQEQLKTYIPTIINEFASVLEKLHKGGARTFWVHNTSPFGCLSVIVKFFPPAPNITDKSGYVKSYNKIAQDFNKQLKVKVSLLRTQFQEAMLVFVDIYSVKYSLINEANKHGKQVSSFFSFFLKGVNYS
uniref:GDSL esterase/lipase At5g14450-like n=1 Tax=Erigeron canadensis TaxID=72917 RepID=UPI001CB95EB8|nr:GDSL esterase/lipase At5g14450-like [Erigeron canadensis]